MMIWTGDDTWLSSLWPLHLLLKKRCLFHWWVGDVAVYMLSERVVMHVDMMSGRKWIN